MKLRYFFQLMIIMLPVALLAFGKNKVQYRSLGWSILNAPHYSVYFHQNQGDLPRISYLWLNEIYGDLHNRFNFTHQTPVPVILYESPALFEQTNIITELLSEEVGGFTELFKTRVTVPYNGSLEELRHVLHHEMVHAFIFGILYEGSSIFKGATVQVPLWFNEGLAEVLSSGWNKEADMFLMDRVLNSTVPLPGPELDGYLAYKGGQSFLYYLYSTGGDSLFTEMLREFKRSKSVDNSIQKIYKKDATALGKEWIRELRRIYWPEIGKRISPSTQAVPITSHLDDKSHFNLHPRISPDGSKIAFFSDINDYTSIIITDRKGKLLQKISQSGYGGFFESFQPFRAGMCWSPDGNSLAFVTKNKGSNEIRIVDIKRKKLRRTIRLPYTAISAPDWSKTADAITFTAIDQGQTDLFIYDLKTSQSRRLTNSVAVENNPRFSPNGQQIIFTIKDTSGLASNAVHPMSNLALYDVAEEKILNRTNSEWNEKQPVFSPNGSYILFVSDRNGIDNLYISLTDSLNEARPLTDYAGGCSNPDWSADAIVFDQFQNQGWDIWLMKDPLRKLQKDTLALTRWAEHEKNDSVPFFVRQIKETADEDSAATATDSTMISDNLKITGLDSTTVSSSGSTTVTADSAKIFSDSTKAATDLSMVSSDSTDPTSDSSVACSDLLSTNGTTTVSVDVVKEETLEVQPEVEIGTTKTTDASDSAKLSFIPIRDIPTAKAYSLRFTPDLMMFGVGLDTYSGVAGQWLMAFSDIMGDHRITLAGDLQGRIDEYMHLYLAYDYLKQRCDISSGVYYSKDYTQDGFYNYFYHDTEFGGFLGLSYPFSIFSRVDLSIYGRHIERVPMEEEGKVTNSNVLLSSLSYSYDNILWGITGPLNGFRGNVRLLMSPAIKIIDESFVSGDVDIRHYLHIGKKFVWANRFTAGASVSISDGKPARRFFLGGSENWFNYNVNQTNYESNLPFSFYSDIMAPLRGWNYFDLTGERAVLFNTEFRFPFIREVSTVWPLPIQIRYVNGAVFADAGNAWDRNDQRNVFPVPDKLYGGIGFGMRANLGIFVLRYDRGWPTDWETIVGPPINYFSLGAEF